MGRALVLVLLPIFVNSFDASRDDSFEEAFWIAWRPLEIARCQEAAMDEGQ